MDYATVRAAQTALVRRSGEAWQQLVKDFDEQILYFRTKVGNSLELVWEGEAAHAAITHVNHVCQLMEQCRDDLKPVGPALVTAAEDIDTCQRQLEAVRDEIVAKESAEWSIDSQGVVTGPADQQARVQNYVAEIESIVARAAQADRAAAHAAEAADIAYDHLTKVLAEERREEEQAAEKAAKLASQPPDELSFDEAKRLARLLRNHGEDPAFAGEFLEDMSSQELLRLSHQVASMGFGWGFHGDGDGPNKLDVLESLQRELGQALATGTSEEGREYLGQDVHNENRDLSGRADRYAQQLMNAAEGMGQEGYRAVGLMLHSGEYSPAFLNPVGDALIPADRADSFTGTVDDLNYVDEHGKGGDPLVGLMVALENNPEAADNFFDPARNPDALSYLLEREWPADYDERGGAPDYSPQSSEQAQKLGRNMLGEALEAATLGGEYRSEAAARVMSATVHELATSDASNHDPSGGAVPPPLRDSIGHMIAGYMGDVHDAVGNTSNQFGMDSNDPEWASYENGIGHANFSQSELYQVMGSAAYDPQAYAEMRNANMVYTEMKLDAIATNEDIGMGDRRDMMAQEAKQAAMVFGALDEAKAYAINEFYDGKDAAYNSVIEVGGTLATWAVAGGSAALAGVPGALAGAAGASAIQSAVEELKQDSSHIVTRETSGKQEEGHNDAARLLQQSLWEHRMWQQDNPPPVVPGSPQLGDHPQRLIGPHGSMPDEYETWLENGDRYNIDMGSVLGRYQDGAGVYASATGRQPVQASEH